MSQRELLREREREREALELFDRRCKEGNPMCQAILNLNPLDQYIAEVRAALLDVSKHAVLIKSMENVKELKCYTDAMAILQEATFSTSDVMPHLMAVMEAMESTWQDLPRDLPEGEDLSVATQASMTDFGQMMHKVVANMQEFWKDSYTALVALAEQMTSTGADATPLTPDTELLKQCVTPLGKLHVSSGAAKRCFESVMTYYKHCAIEMPHSVRDDIAALDVFESMAGFGGLGA